MNSNQSTRVPMVDTRDFHNADRDDIKKEYKFFLKTVQSSAIRTLVDAMKEIVIDTNIVFDEQGMLVKAVDEPHNAMVHVRLNANRFEEYVCNGVVTCGVSLLHLYRLLRTMSTTDVLMLYMHKSQNKLEIRIENNRKAKTSHYKLSTLDLPTTTIGGTSPEFEHAISIESSEFHKIVREMKDLSQHLEIQCHSNTLRFQIVDGAFAEASVNLGVESSNEGTSDVVVQGVFSLKYLSMFTRCSPLSKKVNIFLKNDYPLVLQYDVSDLGTIQLLLMMEDDPRATTTL